jgi:hypothetical protein
VPELSAAGVVEPEAWCPQAPHDFTRIRPERAVTDLVDVLPVIVATENSIVCLRLGEALGDFGVVIEGNIFAIDFEFSELTVQSNVFMPGGDGTKQVGVAVVVAEDGVNGAAGEAFSHGSQGKGGTEIPEKQKALGTLGIHECQRRIQMIKPIVNVREDGEEHGEGGNQPVFAESLKRSCRKTMGDRVTSDLDQASSKGSSSAWLLM